MAEILVTDQLGKPIENIRVDLSHPSSLLRYLKSEALHLAVIPDFLALRNQPLTQAAPKPIQFQAHAQQEFQLGESTPSIHVTPKAKATIRVNASPGTDLFANDPFRLKAIVPDHTAYVSVAFEGSLDAAISGSSGDLSFGFEGKQSIGLEYLRAYPLDVNEAKLGDALGETLSYYVIPASLDDLDLAQFGENDIATASGNGSLKVSGAVSVSASPNPLASFALPLNTGTIAVKAGATVGLSASLTISGAYQVRVRRKDLATIELSIFQQSGTKLQTDLTASAGVTAKFGGTDLIAALLGAVSKDAEGDKKLLGDLTPAEAKTLTTAIKDGIDHSLQTSLDAALARMDDDEAAFQYEIQPTLLGDDGTSIVNKALRGDLSELTRFEEGKQPGDALRPGIKLRNSVFSKALTTEASLKINLLGILNYVTVSELIRHSEVLSDPVTGDLTIKDKTTGTEMLAISEPLDRVEPLRKALFDSVVLTTTYIASNAVRIPGFACNHVHFARHANSGKKEMAEYLNWFLALNLVDPGEEPGILGTTVKGTSTACVLRTAFGDNACRSLFFDETGKLWKIDHYWDYGRRAMRALLQPNYNPYDVYRDELLNDRHWKQAIETGPVQDLAPLLGLSVTHPAVPFLIGDIYAIREWASAMVDTCQGVLDMQQFLATADPITLNHNAKFQKRRDDLQNRIAAMLGNSKIRFDEPWGMVALFWSAGSPQPAYGKITRNDKVLLERGKQSVPEIALPV